MSQRLGGIMSTGEIAFLAFVVGAITLFGGVLARSSWMESREAKRTVRESGEVQQNLPQRARAF